MALNYFVFLSCKKCQTNDKYHIKHLRIEIVKCTETQAIPHACVLLKKKKNAAENTFFKPALKRSK